jgi:hypothetical protein
MSLKRHLLVEFNQRRCRRDILTPMLEKLTDEEIEALYRLIQSVKEDERISQKRRFF